MGSEVSEWELRERQEREEERRAEAEVLGRSHCPCPPHLHGIFVVFFVSFLGVHSLSWDRAEGTRGACNEPPRADCRQENRVKCARP